MNYHLFGLKMQKLENLNILKIPFFAMFFDHVHKHFMLFPSGVMLCVLSAAYSISFHFIHNHVMNFCDPIS